MQHLVTKELLALHDKYDGDLGLLHERWASPEERVAFTSEQIRTLGEYIDILYRVAVVHLSDELRMRTETRKRELEDLIDPEVIAILRQRHGK